MVSPGRRSWRKMISHCAGMEAMAGLNMFEGLGLGSAVAEIFGKGDSRLKPD